MVACNKSRHLFHVLRMSTAAIVTVLVFSLDDGNERRQNIDMVNLEQKWIRDYEPPFETDFGDKDYEKIEEEVFAPLGYRIAKRSIVPGLRFEKSLSCLQIFTDTLTDHKHLKETISPPKRIPLLLKGYYLLNGYVSLKKDYTSQRLMSHKETWTKQEVDLYVTEMRGNIGIYEQDLRSIYNAMKNFKVKGKEGMVIGSRSPRVEVIAIQLGASHVTIVEYAKIKIDEGLSKLSYIHPEQLAEDYTEHIGRYDFIVSVSFLEHIGLGRYGTSLDPVGDLKEAQKFHCLLKPGGLFIARLPIGSDTLIWNKGRIYGRVRLALLAAGYDIAAVFHRGQKTALNIDWFQRWQESDEPLVEDTHWKESVVVMKKL